MAPHLSNKEHLCVQLNNIYPNDIRWEWNTNIDIINVSYNFGNPVILEYDALIVSSDVLSTEVYCSIIKESKSMYKNKQKLVSNPDAPSFPIFVIPKT